MPQLERRVIVPRPAAFDELEAVRLVVAREQRAAAVARPLDEAELDLPACRRLVEVGDPEAHVVEPAQRDHDARPASTSPLGLVLGNRERDVQRVRRHLELLARPGQVDVPLDDRVREPAQAGDLDLDDVARLHRPRVRRRAGEDDVPGLERDQAAEVGELVGDGEEQVVRGRLLHDLPVQERAQGVVGRVELGGGHELGPDRQEAVLALHAQHRAAVGVAEVVQADIVGGRVAGDVVEHLVDRDALHRPPDDHRELALVVQEPRAFRSAQQPR